MKRAEVTEKILTAKRLKELSWEEIAKKIGGASKIIVTAACMGQMKMTKEQATKAAKLFGLGKEETLLLQEVPYRGSLPQVPPTDPLIYRFYELVQVYGTTWKELIQEEFGDGIMSRHRLRHDHGAPARPEGRPREDRHVGQVPGLQDVLSLPTPSDLQPDQCQTRRAVSRMTSSLRHCWSWPRSLPDRPEAKPHCGLIASWPTSMKRLASSMRRSNASTVSTSPVLVVTRPSTTIGALPSGPLGTKRSGSKPPARAVSYSSRRRSKRKVEKSSSAMPS